MSSLCWRVQDSGCFGLKLSLWHKELNTGVDLAPQGSANIQKGAHSYTQTQTDSYDPSAQAVRLPLIRILEIQLI